MPFFIAILGNKTWPFDEWKVHRQCSYSRPFDKTKGLSMMLMTLAIIEIIKILICDSACEMHEKHSVTKSIKKNWMLRVRTQTKFKSK